MFKPKLLLHFEGAAVLLAACVGYRQLNESWRWFGLLFLAPDLFMVGYLVNKAIGATLYNLVHSYTGPLLMLTFFWFAGWNQQLWLPVIWLAHIGFDRMLGYGLKYETAFKDTHFQRV